MIQEQIDMVVGDCNGAMAAMAAMATPDEVGMTPVCWLRGNFHCELIQHPENL